MFAKNVYKLRYLFFGLYPAFCMHHRLTLTPRRAISKPLHAYEYLFIWQLANESVSALISAPFCGFYFRYQDLHACVHDRYFLVIHPIKNKDWDWLRHGNILQQQPVGYFLVFYTIKETAHEECINTDLSSEFNDLEVPRSVTYEPCDRR